MTGSGHRSIGEVLNLLQAEFSDITISKIRFLESQGLIDPERTPSGYRKFTDADVERLRWILRQQRENFLPLKVIKDRLDEGQLELELGVVDGGGVDGGAGDATVGEPEAAGGEAGAVADAGQAGGADHDDLPAAGQARASIAAPAPAVALSVDELARTTGLTARNISELERYGLISADTSGRAPVYGYDALVVARAAAALRAHGVEARHLRMYKVAAEREAGTYEQLLMPLLKRRSAKGRREAVETLDAVLTLGDQIREALLRQAFGEHLPDT